MGVGSSDRDRVVDVRFVEPLGIRRAAGLVVTASSCTLPFGVWRGRTCERAWSTSACPATSAAQQRVPAQQPMDGCEGCGTRPVVAARPWLVGHGRDEVRPASPQTRGCPQTGQKLCQEQSTIANATALDFSVCPGQLTSRPGKAALLRLGSASDHCSHVWPRRDDCVERRRWRLKACVTKAAVTREQTSAPSAKAPVMPASVE
jgi:hypothetical protein